MLDAIQQHESNTEAKFHFNERNLKARHISPEDSGKASGLDLPLCSLPLSVEVNSRGVR